MTRLDVRMVFPLEWPNGRPRTGDRIPALFRTGGRPLTMTAARQRLTEQLSAMTRPGHEWRTTDVIVTTNIRFTVSGARDQKLSRCDPEDPGVALYFRLDGKSHVLACDKWNSVQDNIGAIAAHIDALRGQERWGVADLQQAFAGHIALPQPTPWWVVLRIDAGASLEQIHAAYRTASKHAHPNAGGDRAAWDRLSAAYEEAKRTKS